MIYLVDQSKLCAQKYLDKGARCTNLQLPIFFVKSIMPDIHHRITYMYVNFQQNWFTRSVKTVRAIMFAKKCNLHEFASTNSIF